MPTITKDALSDLHNGNASIQVLPWTAPVALSGLDFSQSEPIYSLQDSFTLTAGDPDTEDIKIDQKNESIDYSMTEGDYTFAANFPSVAAEVLDYWFEKGSAITGVTSSDGKTYTGQGYAGTKEMDVSILIQSFSGKTAIVLGHVKVLARYITVENHNTPAYIGLTGAVLPNGVYDKFGVLKEATA